MKIFDGSGPDPKKPWQGLAAALCSAVLLYLVLSHFNVVWGGLGKAFTWISPAVTGVIMAYIFNPFAVVIRKKVLGAVHNERVAWPLAVFLTIVLAITFVVLLMVAVVPQLFRSAQTLLSSSSSYLEQLGSVMKMAGLSAAKRQAYLRQVASVVNDVSGQVTDYISSHTGSLLEMVTGTISSIVDGFISFFIAIYVLMDKGHLLAGCEYLLRLVIPERHYPWVSDFWEKCNTIFVRFIWCDLLDGLIIGVANAVFMMIMGMPYKVLVSVVVGATNLAPTFGPLVGAVIGSIILALVHPLDIIWFLLFTIALQTMDGYVIKPRLFGGVLNVPGIWILIMVVIGGRMFGVVGILVAIPFTAIIKEAYQDFLLPWLAERREAEHARQGQEERKESAGEASAAGMTEAAPGTAEPVRRGSSRGGKRQSRKH